MNKIKNGENYDIIIIGAGPAGCIAAHELANEFDVLVIDKGDLPQNKPCGSLLNEDSIDILKNWEDVSDILISPSFLTLGYIDFDNKITIKTKRQFWNTDRKRFSSWLLNRLPKNVTISSHTLFKDFEIVNDGIEVIVNRDSSLKLKTKYLIGADGTLSTVRRGISKIPPRRSTLYQVLVTGSEERNDFTWFVFDTSITNYYSWVIPKGDHTIIGTTIEGRSKRNMDLLLKKISEELKISTKVLKTEGHPATIIGNLDEIVLGTDNILLVGEAAGLISPSSFEGISYALQSGMMAAQAIRTESNSVIDTYRKLCNPICRRLSDQLEKSQIVSNREKRSEYLRSVISE
ncbi:MAG: FAD-dependent monooxygenase [Dehalococcoidia bacterium]|nr:FAD-dependent monooxygenase [Chloroflexota bacterium]MCK4242163.1 FAD-dependent monooxygenase [Dehalococcoidia bacterium]